jgi:WD40 repeat protein
MGNICVWAVRPSRLKSKCIYRHQNLRSLEIGGRISSITCFEAHRERGRTDPSHFVSFLLIGGDERGTISVWNIMPLLKKLQDELHVFPLERPHECANPRRNIRLDVSEIIKKAKRGYDWMSFTNRDPNITFFSPSGMPVISGNLFETVQQWKAHSDIIHSIQLISESMSLVTSSFDRQVKIWRLDGECIGILMQGGMEISKRSWNFFVDHETKQRKKDEKASAVLKEVQKMTLSAKKNPELTHMVVNKDVSINKM